MCALVQLRPNSLYDWFCARTICYQWLGQVTSAFKSPMPPSGNHSSTTSHRKPFSPLHAEKSPLLSNTSLLRSSSSWVGISQLVFYTNVVDTVIKKSTKDWKISSIMRRASHLRTTVNIKSLKLLTHKSPFLSISFYYQRKILWVNSRTPNAQRNHYFNLIKSFRVDRKKPLVPVILLE